MTSSLDLPSRRLFDPLPRAAGGVFLVILLAIPVAGCGPRATRGRPTAKADRRTATTASVSSPDQASAAAAVQPMSREVRDKLLEGAMDVLGNLETYEESVAFPQVFDRLNQWSHAMAGAGNADGWRLDPLLDTLPERLRGDSVTKGIGELAFDAAGDVVALRDQRWLADVAATARGDAIEDLAVARALFDWTIRSLAATSDPPMVPTDGNPGSRWFSTGEILLAGRASAPQRAWVFLELVRQPGRRDAPPLDSRRALWGRRLSLRSRVWHADSRPRGRGGGNGPAGGERSHDPRRDVPPRSALSGPGA